MKAAVPRLRTSSTRPVASRISAATIRIAGVLIPRLACEQPELPRIARRLGQPEMPERMAGEQAPARRALQEALLDQIRLDDLLDRVARLGQRRRDGLDADRPAAVVERDRR